MISPGPHSFYVFLCHPRVLLSSEGLGLELQAEGRGHKERRASPGDLGWEGHRLPPACLQGPLLVSLQWSQPLEQCLVSSWCTKTYLWKDSWKNKLRSYHK